jgi:hypothetical protein
MLGGRPALTLTNLSAEPLGSEQFWFEPRRGNLKRRRGLCRDGVLALAVGLAILRAD